MNLDDIIQIIVKYVLDGDTANPFLNVYWYRCEVEPDPVQGFTEANVNLLHADFMDKVMTPLLLVQSAAIDYVSAHYENWSKPSRPFVDVDMTGVSGSGAGDWLPRYNAWGFRLNRSTNVTRNGAKRFGGVPEAFVTGGEADPTTLPALADVAVGLAQQISFEAGLDTIPFVPVIVRKDVTGSTITASQYLNGASYVRLTTQNTRKR